MLYSMIGICKITQWQDCLICCQQADHVEIYVVLIKTTSQVRYLYKIQSLLLNIWLLYFLDIVTCSVFFTLIAACKKSR